MLNNVIASLSGAGTPPAAPTAYESIATVTVGSGGSSSISFSSIPSTYAHLQIRGSANTTSPASFTVTFNGATSTYKNHYLEGGGSGTPSSGAETNSGIALYGISPSATSTFSAFVWDILDYSNTNKNKVLRALNGWDANGTGFVDFDSGLWVNTNAITSITITPSSNFNQYSSFALYGIKGS